MKGTVPSAIDLTGVVRAVRQRLELEALFGIKELPMREARSMLPKARRAAGHELAELGRIVSTCEDCDLCRTRTQVVFGSGHPQATLMLVGEGPGRDEDLQGEPFVGRAGQLLTKIIEAIGMTREEVYITNVVKCRPPNNRPPLPSEIAACRPKLLAQLDLIRPKVICALGKYAAQTLLQTEETISAIRGQVFDFRGAKLVPTFHPAYLLRNPQDKRLVWADMKLIKRLLEG